MKEMCMTYTFKCDHCKRSIVVSQEEYTDSVSQSTRGIISHFILRGETLSEILNIDLCKACFNQIMDFIKSKE